MGAGLSPGQVLHEDIRGGEGPLRVWQGGLHQGLPLGVPGHQVGGGLPEDHTGAEWTWVCDWGDLLLSGTSLQYGAEARNYSICSYILPYL